MKRVAIYAKVSTGGQTTENQVRELKAAAARMGWEVAGIYTDQAISGAKGRDKRPEFDKMIKAAVRRDVDVIAAWSVDRLGRSLQHLVEFLGEIHAKGVDLYLHQQGIDTTTPAGKAIFQMCGVFAEFERAMIQERIRAGLARARADGKQLGRPQAPPEQVARILEMRRAGTGMLSIAKAVGCGSGTVQRVVRAHAVAA